MNKHYGVLLLNLGSPESTRVSDVRKYLKEFLSDERVLDCHPLIRSVILHGIILPRRPHESAEAYRKIWKKEGSPLIIISRELQQKLQDQVDIPIELAMRYGNPSVSQAIQNLKRHHVEHILIVPLYPHYAMSSYETALVHVQKAIRNQVSTLKTTLLQPFYNRPGYIRALVETAKPYISQSFDLLLFSFHGIPRRHLIQTDPSHEHCMASSDCCQKCHPAHATCYRHQCFETVKAFVQEAGLLESQYAVSFQSRLGREPWLEPYTDEVLQVLPRKGIKNIFVICPAFVSDCLETLEEIAVRGRESFLENGGQSFEQIPCLNTHPTWIRYLQDEIQNWIDTDTTIAPIPLAPSR